jgi:ABC-type bacteriocin/lantibiotic exporter with double-glycine peptidase domain
MVLSRLGLEIQEAELRALCDCTPFGTEALKAVDAARQLGFSRTSKHTLSADELAAQVSHSVYPIVFVNLLPLDGVKAQHAVVVIAMDQVNITVYDPLQGERILPRATFDAAWATMHHLAILVQP